MRVQIVPERCACNKRFDRGANIGNLPLFVSGVHKLCTLYKVYTEYILI